MTDSPSLTKLQDIIRRYPSLAIAFSGGTDSTLLACVAAEILGDKTLLVHIRSPLIKPSETDFCVAWAQSRNIKCLVIDVSPFDCEPVRRNHPLRCYYCKRVIIEAIRNAVAPYGVFMIADGANCDDLNDYRPGLRASDELGVIHPLIEAGFTKMLIRQISHAYKLPNWNTPAAACLASRVSYHTELTPELLSMIASAEEFISNLGFSGCRVRYVEKRAEIEVDPSLFRHILDFNAQITDKLKALGFIAVLLNLEGYCQGAMNRTITNDQNDGVK